MRLLRPIGLLLAVFVSLTLAAAPAWGHSFLVDTQPGQGERLASSASEIVLQFTEAVVPSTVEVGLSDDEGVSVPAGGVDVESNGRVLRVRLAEPLQGLVVVSWHVVSAVDGHESAGEFAFAVGETGTLPDSAGTQAAGTGETVWRWMLVAGLSLGVGSLIASATGQIPAGRGVRWARLGLAVAAIGPAAIYLKAIAGGLSEGTIAVGAAGLLISLAALSVGRTRSDFLAPTVALAGVLAWASRSHATSAQGALGTLADAAHLTGAALWFGTLTLLVFDLWRAHTEGDPLLEAARRYSHWALRAVVVLAVAGVASALTLLTAVSDLWTSDFGRLLLVKVGLFVVALVLAAASRWKALVASNLDLLRRLVSVEVVVVASIVAASGLLAATPPPALAQAGETLLGPPPIEGPVARAAGLAGNMTVGAQAGDGRLDLLVYNSSTGGIEDASLDVTATFPDGTGIELHPRPCGAGCFTQQLSLPEGTTTMAIGASSQDWTDGAVDLAIDWPPPPAQPELLDQVIAAMRDVDGLTLTETVNSGPGAEATSSATIDGNAFIDLEVYAQGEIDQVSALSGRDDGIRIYLPGSRILIDLQLDAQNRIIRERIVSPGHEITRDLTYP